MWPKLTISFFPLIFLRLKLFFRLSYSFSSEIHELSFWISFSAEMSFSRVIHLLCAKKHHVSLYQKIRVSQAILGYLLSFLQKFYLLIIFWQKFSKIFAFNNIHIYSHKTYNKEETNFIHKLSTFSTFWKVIKVLWITCGKLFESLCIFHVLAPDYLKSRQIFNVDMFTMKIVYKQAG